MMTDGMTQERYRGLIGARLANRDNWVLVIAGDHEFARSRHEWLSILALAIPQTMEPLLDRTQGQNHNAGRLYRTFRQDRKVENDQPPMLNIAPMAFADGEHRKRPAIWITLCAIPKSKIRGALGAEFIAINAMMGGKPTPWRPDQDVLLFPQPGLPKWTVTVIKSFLVWLETGRGAEVAEGDALSG